MDGSDLHVPPTRLAGAVGELEFMTQAGRLPGVRIGQPFAHAAEDGGRQGDGLGVGEQMVDRLVEETGKGRVDQHRLATRVEADDADGGVVENGAEEGFPFLHDALALAQCLRAAGDGHFQIEVGLQDIVMRLPQVFAHGIEGGGELLDFCPRGIADHRRFEMLGADAGAFLGQGLQGFAEAFGHTDGDNHAQGQRRQHDQAEQQHILPGDRHEVAFRGRDAQPDAAGVVLDRPEQAEPLGIILAVAVQAMSWLGVGLPRLEGRGQFAQIEFFRCFEQGCGDRLAVGEARVARRGDQAALLEEERGLALRAERHAGGEFGDVEEADIVADHIAGTIGCLPAHGGRNARFLGREEDVGLGPEHRPVIGQGHGTLEPRAFARVVVTLVHGDAFNLPVGVPGNPVGLPAPGCGIGYAVDPAPLLAHQQQDLASRFVGENDRRDFTVVGDDGEEELVEAQQLVMVDIGMLAPALATAQGHLDGLEQAAETGFELFGRQFHLGLGQAVDGRLADQVIEGKAEGA